MDLGGVEARLSSPNLSGLIVTRDLSEFVLKAGGMDPFFGQTPLLGKQLPSPRDGLLLVVISKGPVAEHLEEGVVGIVGPDILEIVVFARYAHAFLRVDCPRIGALSRPKEDIFELDHAGVCE